MQNILRSTFLLLLFSTFLNAQERQTIKQHFSVQTVKVKMEQKFVSKKYYGYVKAAESRIIDVSARYEGYIEKLYVDELYVKVKKGQPLATVYSPKISHLKNKFLESFRYKQAEVTFDARERLELRNVSKADLDGIVKTKKYFNDTMIHASIDGYIFEKSVTHGTAFKDKDMLFKIVNLDEVWIEVKIPQEQIPSLETTKHFEVALKATPKTFHTMRSKLYPNFSSKEATATLRLTIENKDHILFPGMYASVTAKEKTAEYLTLPRTAVIRKNGTFYAFVATDFEGEYEPIKLEVKPLDTETFIIEAGLTQGDTVVNNALFLMDSDAQINALY